MQAVADTATTFAEFNLGAGEIILILALVLILFGAKQLPKAARGLSDDIDDESRDAGRSLGGIYGKRASQALTPDNQVAELYDPAVLRANNQPHKRRIGTIQRLRRLWSRIWSFVRTLRHRDDRT